MRNNDIKNELQMTPTYWASVSGGKDSLVMLRLILNNLDKYPLNGVVHFELEIDYPFIKNVIDYMENECKRYGIPFYRIKPRRSWYDMIEKYGLPMRPRRLRWCNTQYKLDCKAQFNDFQKSYNNEVFYYVGLCADETDRFNDGDDHSIYPLVNEGIDEPAILKWAKTEPLFNGYYKSQLHCGCMFCPCCTYLNLAYLLKYYAVEYEWFMRKVKEHEIKYNTTYFQSNPKYNADYVDNIVRTKWLAKLEEKENEQ